MLKKTVVWEPQPGPQTAYIHCPLPEIFLGGARGGSKSDAVLGKAGIRSGLYKGGYNGVIFRREMPSQDDLIERSREIYAPLGAVFTEWRKAWRFPGGGRLRFRPLDRLADADKYQGQNLSDAIVEEAGLYPDPKPIDRLHACLRSPHGVPTQLTLTGNPGGLGQWWLADRYVSPEPRGFRVLTRKVGRVEHPYIYIPARVWDNKKLLEKDPGYIDRLHLVGSNALVRAWLYGDFSAVEGAYFDCWAPERHVIRPINPPSSWTRFSAMDWGSAAPACILWFAVSDGGKLPDGRWYPKGALVVYREYYAASSPNVGLKLPAEDLARQILARQGDERLSYSVAGHDLFIQNGGPSIAERMGAAGLHFSMADNKRVSGWDQVRARLIGMGFAPMLYVANNCTNLIRVIPSLQHDEHNAEDVDGSGDDHPAEALRYGAMSRPWVSPEESAMIGGVENWNRFIDIKHRLGVF